MKYGKIYSRWLSPDDGGTLADFSCFFTFCFNGYKFIYEKKISYLKKSWIGIRMPGFESSFQQWLHESKKNPPSGDTLPHLSHRMNEGLNQDSEQEMHVGK